MAILETLLRISDQADWATEADRKLFQRFAADGSLDSVTRAVATGMVAGRSPEAMMRLATSPREGILVRFTAAATLAKDKAKAAELSQRVGDRSLPAIVRFTLLAAMGVNEDSLTDGALRPLATDATLDGPLRRLAIALFKDVRNPSRDDDTETVRSLLSMLGEHDPEIQLAAAEALDKRGNDSDLRPAIDAKLYALATGPGVPSDLRAMAAKSISRVTDIEGAAGRFAAVLGDDTADLSVRAAAAEALKRFDALDPANATTYVAVLTRGPARLTEQMLNLLNKFPPDSAALHAALKPALPWFDRFLPRANQVNIASALSLLRKLAAAGFLRTEIAADVSSLRVLAREGQGLSGDPADDPATTLAAIAEVSAATRAFLTALALDRTAPPARRATAVMSLAATKARLGADELGPLITDQAQPVDVRIAALIATGQLGAERVPSYVGELTHIANGRDPGSSRLRAAAFEALRGARVFDGPTVTAAVSALLPPPPESTLADVVDEARQYLESLGSAGKGALEQIVQALGNGAAPSPQRMKIIAGVMVRLATDLADATDVSALPVVESALVTLRKRQLDGPARDMARAVAVLENAHLAKAVHAVFDFMMKNVALTIGLAYVLLAFLLGVVLLAVAPFAIFRLDEAARRLPEISLPKWLGGVTVSARSLLVMTMFRRHRRVLAAWVRKAAPTVRVTFGAKTVVEQRIVCVPMPASVNGQPVLALGQAALAEALRVDRFAVAFEGEGGAGKSTMAFLMGRLAMAESPQEQLHKTMMLPVLIDSDLVGENPTLLGAIAAELSSLVRSQEILRGEFVRALAAQQHLLIIVDGLSERSAKTQEAIVKGISDIPVSALVVTSRREVQVPGAKIPIRPLRIQGNSVATFLHGYLEAKGERRTFTDDEEFFRICKDLSALTRGRDITPLLAKMYAEYAVARKLGRASAESAPRNVPELMISYARAVAAGQDGYDWDATQQLLRTIAWECVSDAWIPGTASRERVRQALGDDADAKLRFAIERLQFVQETALGVRFTLDPLAEYLAAMHVLVAHGHAWSDTLERLRAGIGNGRADNFRTVLEDCYRCPEIGKSVSDDVVAKLLGAIPAAQSVVA
ncbi:MAG TPA: hypothetical protein VIF57_10790 [Polyangia bacterium]